ncbi:hypothetical protein CVIRNUC_008531 [Coccomyxa viridis]|uniref:Uncharacterized protein n=1 Tax=Coccomyxa viridis TaxID=1274662 RepID=A0AAV1ID91_9CHLO|nr:hypothetical protein CVIRNUC_008531 [Coccomyxa viridis]
MVAHLICPALQGNVSKLPASFQTSSPAVRCCSRRLVQASAMPDLASPAAFLAQMVPPPSTTAAAQNSIQNTLQNAPLSLQEAPERLLIAGTLIAVAIAGYLLREKAQKKS